MKKEKIENKDEGVEEWMRRSVGTIVDYIFFAVDVLQIRSEYGIIILMKEE